MTRQGATRDEFGCWWYETWGVVPVESRGWVVVRAADGSSAAAPGHQGYAHLDEALAVARRLEAEAD